MREITVNIHISIIKGGVCKRNQTNNLKPDSNMISEIAHRIMVFVSVAQFVHLVEKDWLLKWTLIGKVSFLRMFNVGNKNYSFYRETITSTIIRGFDVDLAKNKNIRKYDITYGNMNFEGKLSIYTCKIYKVGYKLQCCDWIS